jgi:hypothetical protein
VLGRVAAVPATAGRQAFVNVGMARWYAEFVVRFLARFCVAAAFALAREPFRFTCVSRLTSRNSGNAKARG